MNAATLRIDSRTRAGYCSAVLLRALLQLPVLLVLRGENAILVKSNQQLLVPCFLKTLLKSQQLLEFLFSCRFVLDFTVTETDCTRSPAGGGESSYIMRVLHSESVS